MKITHLGQAGLLLQTDDLTIMIDPYFTDAVGQIDPNKHRRVEMDEALWTIRPDVLIFTHDHLDHYEPETAKQILSTHKGITVLCPNSVWQKVRLNGGDHNYVLFDRHTQWTERGVRFSAVKAAHSDSFAIGVVIKAENRNFYITGDTLYNKEIFPDLPETIHYIFLPVNGVGNNMNAFDAARFVRKCGAKVAVPMHTGMFDGLTGHILEIDNKVVLATYESVEV